MFNSEKALLEGFVGKITKTDPDLIVCHNLCGGVFDLLLQRVAFHKVSHSSRLGRLKR